MWQELLGRFRTLGLFYQQCHWSVNGSWFYQDHLLLDRLYNDVFDQIDGIAEKGIAASGSNDFVLLINQLPLIISLLSDYPPTVTDNLTCFTSAIRMETELHDFLAVQYDAVTDAGVSNFLQGFMDDALQRIYLLNARTALK